MALHVFLFLLSAVALAEVGSHGFTLTPFRAPTSGANEKPGDSPGGTGAPPPPSVFRRIVTFHIKWGPFKEQWEHVGEL